MPGLVGSVTDNAFAVDEIFLTSIADLPFDGYFPFQELAIHVTDDVTATESVQVVVNPLIIDAVDTVSVVEAVQFSQLAQPEVILPSAGGSPSSRRQPALTRFQEDLRRLRQLKRLRKLLDDEEILSLLE